MGDVHGSLGLALGTEEVCVHTCFWVRPGGGHCPAWLTHSELSCHSGEWPGETSSAGGLPRPCRLLGLDIRAYFRTLVILAPTARCPPRGWPPRGWHFHLGGGGFARHQTFHPRGGGAASEWGLLLSVSWPCGGSALAWDRVRGWVSSLPWELRLGPTSLHLKMVAGAC